MATTTTDPLNKRGIVGADPTTPAPVPPAPVPPPAAPKIVTGVDPTKTTDAKATNWNVDNKQTVQGQIAGIVAADSPLMQQAATMAKQQANQRGLLNSSMAVGAGQNAVYNAALPIAQQDASTYAAAGKYRADAANAVSTFNAGEKNKAAVIDTNAKLTLTQQGNDVRAKAASQAYDAALQTAMQATDIAGKGALAKLDGDIRQKLGEIEAKYKTQMQSSASMAETYSGLVNNITSIMANPDMDGPAKQAAINNLTKLYNNALQTQEAIAGMDLGALLTFPKVNAPAPSPGPSPGPAPGPTPTPTPWDAGGGTGGTDGGDNGVGDGGM